MVLDQSDDLACVFSAKPELIPDDLVQRQYVLDLYRARKAWVEGDRTLLDNFPDYESKYPNIKEELVDQIAFIRGITSQDKNTPGRAAAAMVVYSEVEREG